MLAMITPRGRQSRVTPQPVQFPYTRQRSVCQPHTRERRLAGREKSDV